MSELTLNEQLEAEAEAIAVEAEASMQVVDEAFVRLGKEIAEDARVADATLPRIYGDEFLSAARAAAAKARESGTPGSKAVADNILFQAESSATFLPLMKTPPGWPAAGWKDKKTLDKAFQAAKLKMHRSKDKMFPSLNGFAGRLAFILPASHRGKKDVFAYRLYAYVAATKLDNSAIFVAQAIERIKSASRGRPDPELAGIVCRVIDSAK
jgi:hypothetical protein